MAVYRRLMTRMTARIDERGLKVPGVVLVENRLMLEECRRRKVARVELCPPGVDTDAFRPGPGLHRRPYVLLVARLGDTRKNVSGLLRAFARAKAVGSFEYDLVLAGLSPPRSEDMALIKELELGSSLEIRSPVSKPELVDLYQGADLFVSASFEEGLGLTYLEAMACGLPVVTSENAGAAFIFDQFPVGAMVTLDDNFTEAFAVELARWCQDADLRRTAGKAARELVESRFSKQVTACAFIEAIESVSC